MTPRDIIRAWKDEAYRASLSDAQRSQLPEHPVGLAELTDADLDGVSGGAKSMLFTSTHYCIPGLRPRQWPPVLGYMTARKTV